MSKKLAMNVYVNGTAYEAGSTPPKDVADQITNPKAWGADESDDSPKAPAKKAVASKSGE
jgi:hypothetical protein